MRSLAWLVFASLVSIAMAAANPLSFSEAERIWQQNKDKPEYQTYAAEFTQFNNSLHLDEKDGCYGQGTGPVRLLLVITHPAGEPYARITQTVTDVDNAKAQCFRKSYRGIQTKVPPFLPFVFQMDMGG